MKRAVQAVLLSILAAEALVIGQGADAKRVLSEVRAALGGEEKLAAVKSVSIEGQVSRASQNGTTSSEFELAFELPDKYVKVDVYANINGVGLKRRVGFNGAEAIEETDTPPMMGGGGMHMVRMGPGGPMPAGGQATPEMLTAQRAAAVAASRREFARLALGLLGTSTVAFPLEFKYAGQAEAQSGKADVLEVHGADGFTAKFFIDSKTHLPLMVSWMDREPLRITMGPGDDMTERMKQAEANRRIVEYRTFYGDYKAFNGLNLPTRIQRMIDGVPADEMALEKIKVNQKIDASKFKTVK
jgi:hypothetical protein